jgi:amino-acid N-acetyltransferase
MSIAYRKAQKADEATVRTLLEHAGLHTESIGTGTTEFYVVEETGAIIGVAGFEFYGVDALLRSVAITSNLRNKGIGSAFIDWMLSTAKARGTGRIVLLTRTAEGFFGKKGFVTVDRSQIANEAMMKCSEFAYLCPASCATMVLNLR